MKLLQFVETLRDLEFENVFNPYSTRCVENDLEDAPERRLRTLHSLLEVAIEREIDSVWIGRDLGYRGGRRTGLAFTDDEHSNAHAKRWGLSIERPTRGEVVAERTAAVVWSVLSQIKNHVFLWNVFPLHPHQPGDPFSNRSHNSLEREAGEYLLSQLVSLLEPQRLIAIGNVAARTAQRLGGRRSVAQVRHPSYGGQAQFVAQMSKLYGLTGAKRGHPQKQRAKNKTRTPTKRANF